MALTTEYPFRLLISYQEVRLGRSIHIVDMADEKIRAAYTAFFNIVIGIILIAGGTFGALAHQFGDATVMALIAAMSLPAAVTASRLREVQRD
jgi:hypothetical protein